MSNNEITLSLKRFKLKKQSWRKQLKKKNISRKNKKKKVTIDDVARHLNISKATVSLALNNSPLVAKTTKIRVVEAAEELGYWPNYFAACLSQGSSATIGLYILEGEARSCRWTLPSSWMFYHPIMKGVTTQLSRKGYRLQLEVVTIEQVWQEQVIARTVQEGALDGILLVVQDDICYDFVNVAIEMEFPLVVLNARIPQDVSSVKIDNEEGAKKVVEYLLGLGHKKIGYISGPVMDINAIERRKGFLNAIEAAGLRIRDEYLKYGDWQVQSGEKLAEELAALKDPPSAIFCANDHMAVGAIRALKALGFKVPENISIVGYDDTELSKIVTPSVTTVRQSLEVMGEIGAQDVLRQIQGGVSLIRHTNLEPELIIRESTAEYSDMSYGYTASR